MARAGTRRNGFCNGIENLFLDSDWSGDFGPYGTDIKKLFYKISTSSILHRCRHNFKIGVTRTSMIQIPIELSRMIEFDAIMLKRREMGWNPEHLLAISQARWREDFKMVTFEFEMYVGMGELPYTPTSYYGMWIPEERDLMDFVNAEVSDADMMESMWTTYPTSGRWAHFQENQVVHLPSDLLDEFEGRGLLFEMALGIALDVVAAVT